MEIIEAAILQLVNSPGLYGIVADRVYGPRLEQEPDKLVGADWEDAIEVPAVTIELPGDNDAVETFDRTDSSLGLSTAILNYSCWAETAEVTGQIIKEVDRAMRAASGGVFGHLHIGAAKKLGSGTTFQRGAVLYEFITRWSVQYCRTP